MKADKNLLSGSTTLLVLSLLSTGDKYGYEMIAELDERSDHTITGSPERASRPWRNRRRSGWSSPRR